MSRFGHTLKTRLVEFAGYSPVVRSLRAALLLVRSAVGGAGGKFVRRARAYALTENDALKSLSGRLVRTSLEEGRLEAKDVAPARYLRVLEERSQVTRTVLVKAPGADGEKGVLISTFEYNWLRILSGIDDFEAFEKRYTTVFSTSWSPTSYEILGLAVSRARGEVLVQACNHEEKRDLEAFHPRVRCIDTLPCDWLHPDFYKPIPWGEREIDILVVSNWAPFKRHWQLFDVLRRMPSELRIVCVGQREGRYDLNHIQNLKALYGVPQKIEFKESLSIDEVTALQCDSRIAMILSRREGCCIAATEGLMAGAALTMREDAHVGPKAYIDGETGIRLTPGREHLELMQMLESGTDLRPRDWAVEHISGPRSLDKLNALLREQSARAGLPWTTDAALPCWRPHPRLYHEEDRRRLAPAYGELHANYPKVFGADLIETSCR